MAIYRMVGNKKDLEPIPETSFGKEGVLERQNLQHILRDKPEILEDGLFIITEEFSNWQGSGRSIDLLALDQTGRLVVVELKRGETGEHMDLQAIRYAAMVSTMTLQQAIDAHQAYLNRRGLDEDAEELVNGHLENLDDSQEFSTEQPRIVLVSEGFSPELTTSVLWLNRNGLDITCIRMQPYRNEAELLVETSQVIPLPEAADYLVRIREREEEQRRVLRHTEQGQRYEGADLFKESIDSAPKHLQKHLTHLYEWAVSLAGEELAELTSHVGKDTTLQIRVGKGSLVTFCNQLDKGDATVRFWGNYFRRFAPDSISKISKLIGGKNLSEIKMATVRPPDTISKEILAALRDAYREANQRVGG